MLYFQFITGSVDNIYILLLAGFAIGTIGTLIGAGGGFVLVPLLLFTNRNLSPEIVTAISMAIVAANAVSGSVAYARKGRIDYKAGMLFAAFTIPGSILGVFTTKYIPRFEFRILFGLLLIFISVLLFIKREQQNNIGIEVEKKKPHWKLRVLKDYSGHIYQYAYSPARGIIISIIVGYLSPLLGIGGGIIHVPALAQLLFFPVHIATATSHFILAIMSVTSVIVHAANGNYNDPQVLKMVVYLAIGAIAGAQLGAYLSHKIHGNSIIRVLAVCLGLVGLRILIAAFIV